MTRSVSFVVVLLLLCSVGFATETASLLDQKVPATRAYPSNVLPNPQLIPQNVWCPGDHPLSSELDEFIGDTLSVGNTYYSEQHNCSNGRNIAFTTGTVMINNAPETNVAFFSWMDKPTANTDVHIAFNRAFVDGDGSLQVEHAQEGYRVDSGTIGAYTTLAFDNTNLIGFPIYHGGNTEDDMNNILAYEWNVYPGTFIETDVAQVGDDPQFWPVAVFDSQNSILHMVTTVNPPDPNDDRVQPLPIYYSRHAYDPATQTFTVGQQTLLCEWQRNISADIAVSEDGSRVAVAATISRDYFEHPGDITEWTQYNQDLWVYVSEDGGLNWNDPLDLTEFIPPNMDLLPDSVAANRDTLRAYCDANVYFDRDEKMHVAFTTSGFYQLHGTINVKASWIYHWDEVNDVFTLAVDGYQYCYDPGSWHRAADRPSMYQDPATGVLYMVYQQIGLNVLSGDSLNPLYATNTLDYSQSGFGNAEVFVTASPPGDYNGLLWAKGINLTNTRYNASTQGAATGEARCESSPTISLYNDGPYLNTFFIMDYEGGNANQQEGAFTQCNAVWLRSAKEDILASFDEWVVNYPIHIDSTQFWYDDHNYDWEEANGFWRWDVDEQEGDLPERFELEQNFPNPFNPETRIAFTLHRAGQVKLSVYDLLGRQVAVLTNGIMNSGRHEITFNGADLASGVYFYKLESGNMTSMKRMVLLK